MEIREAIRERRSVRAYRPDPVPEAALEAVLEAARLAPSGSNRQPWRFVVVTDPRRRVALVGVARGQRFVGEAPVVIAAVALEPDRVMSCQVPAYAVDLAIAVDHMTLAAVAEGLGTCWIGSFDQDQARELLNIPPDRKIVALLPLGYPADRPAPKKRKALASITCREQWSE
ncbi:MAG: nitroreductase family protein [bacterium]|nr:nitroreductase family protein [bacterium]